MKKTIRGLPYWEITFDKDGNLTDDTGLQSELAADELFIFGHGWNSSPAGARRHYDFMFDQLAQMAPGHAVGFAGVIWPSLLFPQDDPAPDGPLLASPADTQSTPLLPPGPSPAQAPESTGAEIAAALAPAFPNHQADLATLGGLLDQRPQDPRQLLAFIDLTRGLIGTDNDAEEDRGEAMVLTAAPRTVLDTMSMLAPPEQSDAQAGLNPFGALWKGAKELLRVASYYEMKNRAGVVGQRGLGPLLGRLAGRPGAPRIHLMGHSFGARLVAFTLAGLPPSMRGHDSPVKSLMLIQGAFSHFAFAGNAPVSAGKGVLAGERDRVDGPLLATFSGKDRAVGWWYPNASRLAWQDAQAMVNPNFRWGGMGNNGYQQAAAQTVALGPAGSRYKFQPGTFYRLDGNDVIAHGRSFFSGAHSDIDQPHLAWAATSAAGLA
ncbi:hypothetical protein ACTI_59070 [Actinoplanes sp. OR16]|uniref:serine/threonine protein kinase n=1 Tax=Actinoplanes sp. OR16 TaxID=946334 RepID=UPI000F717F9B|nr:serine/threonine protein kinase [Actinoplanes sp. OR16]BBH69222.1 hypothetical protein ACTI_59070 [Actinoplanes sp. OR16]